MTADEFILAIKLAGLKPRTNKIPHLLDVYFDGKNGEELLVSSLHLGGVADAELDRTLEWVVTRAEAMRVWR